MSIVLVGGGPDTTRTSTISPFLDACSALDGHVAVLNAGTAEIAAQFAWDYLSLLEPLDADVRVVPLEGGPVAEEIRTAAALVVAGGPTPQYMASLDPHADLLRERVRGGVPYLGFSAGAAVASVRAQVGGYRLGGVEVCPQEWSEDLEELTYRRGLGLVPWTVDAHAAQAGTLGRIVRAVEAGLCEEAVAIDEDTALVRAADGSVSVTGSGQLWWVRTGPDGVRVMTQRT